MATVLPTHTPAHLQAAVERAADLLRAGGLVALPTETVYGLAANALDAESVGRIFEVKGRPAHNPIIVHVSGVAMARDCASSWPESATQLATAFWPGPLTLVLPKAGIIPGIVTAGGPTAALRWPRHPVFQAVLEKCGFPLAAPSANLSGQVSPTAAAHVAQGLGDRVPLILDGGPADVGIESTVIDLSAWPPRVLRPGMIHVDSLRAVLGKVSTSEQAEGALRSPGLLLKHYSPKAKLIIWEGGSLALPEPSARTGNDRVHVLVREITSQTPRLGSVSLMPREPGAFARALYSELHRLDAEGAGVIVVEGVPDTPEWHAIADRLRRAAA